MGTQPTPLVWDKREPWQLLEAVAAFLKDRSWPILRLPVRLLPVQPTSPAPNIDPASASCRLTRSRWQTVDGENRLKDVTPHRTG